MDSVPAGWNATTLGELADYLNGYAFKPRDWKEHGLPIVRIAQMTDPSAPCDRYTGSLPPRYLVDSGDLLFSWSATLMTLIWDRGPAYLNQHVFKVVPKAGTNLSFLHHLLDYKMETLAGQTHGTTMKHIKRADLLPLRVRVPSAREQRRIGDILDTLDETIRATEQLIAKLHRMKEGLRQDLLTRGVDENGEIRDPAQYPAQFGETRLGRLPTEWRVEPLAAVATLVTSGSRGWGRYYAERGALFIRIGNLSRKSIDLALNDVAHVRPPAGGEGERTRVEKGDLLISITADLGITGVVPAGLGEAYVNQHIALVRVDPLRVNPRWLGHFVAARGVQTQIRRHDDPGAKAGLNLPTVRRLWIAMPPKAEQDKMALRLDAADEAITAEEAYRGKLNLLKVGLQEDLLSGRVRVTKFLDGDAA